VTREGASLPPAGWKKNSEASILHRERQQETKEDRKNGEVSRRIPWGEPAGANAHREKKEGEPALLGTAKGRESGRQHGRRRSGRRENRESRDKKFMTLRGGGGKGG